MRAALLLCCSCVEAGGAPQLGTLQDRVAIVGDELRIELDGTDPDGDRLHYTFHAPADLELGERASMTVAPSGVGVFRWTPLAADLGTHAFDFEVSDGSNAAVTTINIDVIASATAPIFRSPIGTGTTLDLSKKDCIDLEITVEDYDTAAVTVSQDGITGAMLAQHDGTHATWHWCPTSAQRAESRHTLVLTADDGTTQTVKNFLVILHDVAAPTCTDDSHEQDDSAAQARATTYPMFSSPANMLCKDDDDWFEVPLYAGEVMTVDLTFTQHDVTEDIDLHLYKGGVDLMPCSVTSPGLCATSNGQSGHSNEHMTFTAPAACTSACTYYVVVRGFDGGASPYDITIGVQ